MLLTTLLESLPGWTSASATDMEVCAVTDKVQEVVHGTVFVAIAGSNFDGHTVLQQAVQNGACVVVTCKPHELLPPSIIEIIVPDTRLALALMLRSVMSGVAQAVAELTWIGVTGTNGKTTVATLVEQLLHRNGQVTAFIGTTFIGYRNPDGDMVRMDTTYTTPHARQLYELALLFREHGVTHVVMEVSSHGLHQHRVAGLTFSAAVFTNLTRDHLDYHRTMSAYANAKKMLFDGLGKGAVAVVYGKSEYGATMLEQCSADRQYVVDVEELVLNAHGSKSTVNVSRAGTLDKKTMYISTPLLGEFNAVNSALACTVAIAMGMSREFVEQTALRFAPPSGRMERIVLPSGTVAVVDYAHTPDALEQALRTLRGLTEHLTVVFGCGGNRDKGKRSMMGTVAAGLADEVWLTSDNPRDEDPRSIIADITSGIPPVRQVHIEVDRAGAIKKALLHSNAQSIVLIAGKGHEAYQEIHGVRTHFSDQEVVRSLL